MKYFLAQSHDVLALAADAPGLSGAPTFVASVCGLIASGIVIIGVAVLVYGVAKAAVMVVRNEVYRSGTCDREHLRMELGYYLLLGLEIMVAADIIETLMAPDLNHVMVLGAIVLIRTVISFSLNWELAHERQRTEVKQQPEVV